MNCDSSKCKKSMSTPHPCTKCLKKFCAKACMIDHFFEAHLNENNQTTQFDLIGSSRRSPVKSKFIKPGKYIKEFIPQSDYNFSNFEKIKSGSNNNFYILGNGGFGEVFLAKHKKKGFYVAIKEMNKKRILDAGHKLDIIYKEISYNGRLIHDNIIKMYSFHEDETNIYLIMEYADSGNLFGAIRKNGGFSECEAFSFFVQICSAVNFVHENNLIHRDLKPENILLTDKKTVKLCDFGWCVELSVGNRSTFCGTYEYMAPEIIREKPYNHSIDVWSLGILLYELLHGYSPFKAEQNFNDCYEVFDKIIKYDLKFEKELSEDCKDLIIKLLSPDIKTRIKVRDIFGHPWFRSFENAGEVHKSSSVKIDEKNHKNDQNDQKSSNSTKFNMSILNIDNLISEESLPNQIDSQKNLNEMNGVEKQVLKSTKSKSRLQLKDLKAFEKENSINQNNQIERSENFAKSHNNSILQNEKFSKNKLVETDLYKNFHSKNATPNKFASLDIFNDDIDSQSKIVKTKKKIIVAKNSIVTNVLEKESKEQPNIDIYKDAKLNHLKKKKILTKAGNHTMTSKNSMSNNHMSHSKNHDVNMSNNLMELNNFEEQQAEIFESKTTKNGVKNIDYTSERIQNIKKSANKIINKTLNESNKVEINSISNKIGRNLIEEMKSGKVNLISTENNNLGNFKNPGKRQPSESKLNLDFNDNGYDLENFIEKQNTKKTKISNMKSPAYKDGFQALSGKINIESNEEGNFKYINKFSHNEEDFDDKFSKLLNFNKNSNPMNKSTDKSFSEISKDQLKEKINQKKNKSILNALNKTQNDGLQLDNNQMNSSVIDMVFSKIEGKKNKHKNDKQKKNGYDIPQEYFKDEENNKNNQNDEFDFRNFTIKDYISDEKNDDNEFGLLGNNKDNLINGNQEDPRSSRNRKTSMSKKYETTKDIKNLDINNIDRKSESVKNEKENLKNNIIKKKTEVLEKYNPHVKQGKNILISEEDIFNVIPRDTNKNYKKLNTNQEEIDDLIRNFQAKPTPTENYEEKSNKNSHRGKIDLVVKKNSNNNDDIFISNSNHIRNKSNNCNNYVTPGINDEINNLKNDKKKNENREKSVSIEKALRPPKDKKIISSILNNNNNELIYSKEFKEIKRDSNNRKTKKNAEKHHKMNSLSKDYSMNFNDNQNELHRALELLEQANEQKNQIPKEKQEDNLSGWAKFVNFINPFKCG